MRTHDDSTLTSLDRVLGERRLWFSVADVAEILGRSTSSVRRMLAAGELPARRFGRSLRIHRDDVKKLAEK